MESREKLPPSDESGLFGEYTSVEKADVVVVGVPWEPTASYGRGTSATPAAIVSASHEHEIFDPFLGEEFAKEVAMAPLRRDWVALNEATTLDAARIIAARARLTPELETALETVNRASERLNRELQQEVAEHLAAGRSVGVLGGDHSCPFGSMLAHLDHYGRFGVLHIDAHFDLRDAFEGFVHSHGSIMRNLLLASDRVEALIPVAIRDYCAEEVEFAASRPEVTPFYDRDLQSARYRGKSWHDVCSEIVAALPDQVYVSFDIDGLDPKLSPHTGTPVPGGLEFTEAVHLLEAVVASGRRIVGFDLVEVTPNLERSEDEWDLNVGSRLLHKLCVLTWMGRSS